jgi:phosphohistidine phosphatase
MVIWPVRHARQPTGCHSGLVNSPRRLIVLRHGKAEPFAATDEVRRLTDRGRAQAAAAGAHLAELSIAPDYALVSSAARTVSTWEAVADACGTPTNVNIDDSSYNGSLDVVLDTLRMAPKDVRTVIFVGHNPTAAYLAHLLDDSEGDPAAMTGLLSGFPPGALAVLEIEVPWSELGSEVGRLVDFFAS